MGKTDKVTTSRNPTLVKGVTKLGRSAAYSRSGRWAVKNKQTTKKSETRAAATKEVPFGKTTRSVPVTKATRLYPAESEPRKKYVRKPARPARVRASLQPGTVAIVLAGSFRGKRVVVLRVLKSGLLLVTGPFKINGVPLRRVNPAYVIATGTKVDLSGVTIDDKINDEYFRSAAVAAKKQKKDDLFEEKKDEKKPVDEGRKADQKAVDAGVLAAVKKVPQLSEYLNAKFTLTKGQRPHLLKF